MKQASRQSDRSCRWRTLVQVWIPVIAWLPGLQLVCVGILVGEVPAQNLAAQNFAAQNFTAQEVPAQNFTAQEVAAQEASTPPADAQGQESPPSTIDFRVSTGLRFLAPDRAELRWETNLEGPATVAYGPTRQLGLFQQSIASGHSHAVVLDRLLPGEPVFYRIGVRHQGQRRISPFYVVDRGLNYSLPEIPLSHEGPEELDRLIASWASPGAIAIVSQELARTWARPLAERSQLTVIAACDDPESLRAIRSSWYEAGIYGVRLSAQLAEDLPQAFANLVVSNADQWPRASQWLSPGGKLICLASDPPISVTDRSEPIQWVRDDAGLWVGTRGGLDALAAWGHQYGSIANTSYAGETLAGADESNELEVRWLGRPGADFGIDRNPRMPAPLAVGGRLFHQGMNRMIALDAFSGAVLWALELPQLRRVNIPRDSANWCADSQRVYAATEDCLWVIDAATGEMLHTIRHPAPFDQGFDWGYVAVTDEVLIGTAVRSGSAYEEFWDKPSWYDGINDAGTQKVCGRAIMVYDKQYGDLRWKREVDAVLHSTITIHDGRLYFVEVEDPSLKDLSSGRLTDDRIWSRASVVCLDLHTGESIWKVKVPEQQSSQVVAFGLADASRFVLETSSQGEFHLAAFDRDSGQQLWKQSVSWPSDNHGAHMQHAVLMNDQLFLQPHILDASSGKVLKTDTLGKRRGCATPIGAGGSIIYRGGTGPVTLWSLDRESPSEFSRLRPSCWLSTIPAQGMLFSPEAGGGCSCGGWMECSIGFAPRMASEEAMP